MRKKKVDVSFMESDVSDDDLARAPAKRKPKKKEWDKSDTEQESYESEPEFENEPDGDE